jgi:5-methylthioadenosine/S-adenosylhomocysteine deaminase
VSKSKSTPANVNDAQVDSLEGAKSPTTKSGFILDHATIVQGAFLPVHEDAALAIRDGKIIDIGSSDALRKRHSELRIFDATGHVIIPGLFNAHTHVPMGFFRGLGHGKTNMIESFLFPAEKMLSAELLEPLSYSYILDGLRGGVTSFVDHYYFSHGVAKAFETFGVRGWIGETVADLGGAFPGRDSWDRAKTLIEKSNFGDLIRHTVAPHAADTVSPKLLKECAEFAKTNALPLHMHLSQSQGELDRVKLRDGLTPVAAAFKAGALYEQSLVVHLTSANDDDFHIIKNSGATMGYCPTSTILYDHLANIKLADELGIPMAIGTDCAASNDSADCLTELKIAGLLAKQQGVPQDHNSPDHLLAMVTTIPAKVLGVSRELGTLEPGKKADLVVLKAGLSALPNQNHLANIIYSMGSRDVSHVMVAGEWKLWNGKLENLNQSRLHDDYIEAVREISARIKPKTTPALG